MKKWYKESYFDRKNWILENFDKLNLNADETMLILLIDLCKQSRKAVTYEYLTQKLHKDSKDIDKMIASLVAKHYLKLTTNAKGLIFDIDGIFEFDPEKYELSVNRDIYELVSDVFGKPLSPSEMQKMNELLLERKVLEMNHVHSQLEIALMKFVLKNVEK